MALGLFLWITGMSAYAGCFGERDGIPKRIEDEEQTEESGNDWTDEELELLGEGDHRI